MSATELFPALGEAAGDLPRLIEPALPGTPEQIVPWRGDKIEEAVQRACVLCGQAVGGDGELQGRVGVHGCGEGQGTNTANAALQQSQGCEGGVAREAPRQAQRPTVA